MRLRTISSSNGTIILLNTYIHLNGSNFCKTQYRFREDQDLYNFGRGAFWKSSFRSALLSVGLCRLRSNEQRFERNNKFTTCFIFPVLLLKQNDTSNDEKDTVNNQPVI